MSEAKRITEEQIMDAFELDEQDREFIRRDMDGYRAAREEANRQTRAFTAWLEGRARRLIADLADRYARTHDD